jgi:glycosyltransferase involved in cell wall biosynthesis
MHEFQLSEGRDLKVAFLTRYDQERASSRVRAYQYLPHLRRLGVEGRILPWANRPRHRWPVYLAQAARLAHWADVVVLQKPFQPNWFIDALARINQRLVVDVDDALWERDSESGQRLDYAARRAGLAIVGSSYLSSCLQRRCSGIEVEVLPSSVELADFPEKTHRQSRPVVAGWIGSPENLTDFSACGDALRSLVTRRIITLRIVSSRPLDLPGLQSEFVPWSACGERDEVAQFDLGLMPLPDTPATRGRCGFKAIEYMAAGVPVVSSALVGPSDVIQSGITGYLVDSQEEWQDRIRQLAADHELRQQLGAAGRRLVRDHFDASRNAPRLASMLANHVNRPLTLSDYETAGV